MDVKVLKKYGWRRIASDAHAAQLLRRELKHHANWQQRDPARRWDYRDLLAIRAGNWYTFNRQSGNCSIVVWRMPSKGVHSE